MDHLTGNSSVTSSSPSALPVSPFETSNNCRPAHHHHVSICGSRQQRTSRLARPIDCASRGLLPAIPGEAMPVPVAAKGKKNDPSALSLPLGRLGLSLSPDPPLVQVASHKTPHLAVPIIRSLAAPQPASQDSEAALQAEPDSPGTTDQHLSAWCSCFVCGGELQTLRRLRKAAPLSLPPGVYAYGSRRCQSFLRLTVTWTGLVHISCRHQDSDVHDVVNAAPFRSSLSFNTIPHLPLFCLFLGRVFTAAASAAFHKRCLLLTTPSLQLASSPYRSP